LIQVSSRLGAGVAQPAMTPGKSWSQVTSNRSDRTVRSSRRGKWKASSGRIPRCFGLSQISLGSSRERAMGNMPIP
jgi:hypothetical protein